jgi:hypothetical protein
MKCVMLLSLPKNRPAVGLEQEIYDSAIAGFLTGYKEIKEFDGTPGVPNSFPEESDPPIHIYDANVQEGGNGGGGDSAKPMKAKKSSYSRCIWNFQFTKEPSTTPPDVRFPAALRPELCLVFDSVQEAYDKLNANNYGALFHNVQIIGVSKPFIAARQSK